MPETAKTSQIDRMFRAFCASGISYRPCISHSQKSPAIWAISARQAWSEFAKKASGAITRLSQPRLRSTASFSNAPSPASRKSRKFRPITCGPGRFASQAAVARPLRRRWNSGSRGVPWETLRARQARSAGHCFASRWRPSSLPGILFRHCCNECLALSVATALLGIR